MAEKVTQNNNIEYHSIMQAALLSMIGVIMVWALTFLLCFMEKPEERGAFGDNCLEKVLITINSIEIMNNLINIKRL